MNKIKGNDIVVREENTKKLYDIMVSDLENNHKKFMIQVFNSKLCKDNKNR